MDQVDLANVPCIFKTEDAFLVGSARVAVSGRLERGELQDRSFVAVVDPYGTVLQRTQVLDLDWFDRNRCGAHAAASAGMNILIFFDSGAASCLRPGNYIVIE